MSPRTVAYLMTGGGSLLYVAAFGVLSTGGQDRQPVAVAFGLVGLTAAAMLLQRGLAQAREAHVVWVRIAVPAVMILAGLALIAYWLLAVPTGGWGLAGLCALYLGVGHALTEWRARTVRELTRGIAVLAVLGAVIVLGVVLCLVWNAYALFLSAFALLFLPVGITLLSEDLLRRKRPWSWAWLGGAAALAVAAAWLLWIIDVPLESTLALAGAAIVLMLAIASNTQADVLLVVTVLAVGWLAVPKSVAIDRSVAPTERQAALVALGDSYMSGEGAEQFFQGTNAPERNECRRSPTAYPQLAVRPGGIRELRHVAFYACSGALARNIWRDPQHPGEPLDPTPELGLHQLAQLKGLLARTRVDVELVIVSIGGNDAGFSSIGSACVAPGSCVALGQQWLDSLTRDTPEKQSVATRVGAAFKEIRTVLDEAEADVPVLVIPYPVPIRARGCEYSPLREDEHAFLNAFVPQLNGVIRNVASEADFYVLEEMEGAFGDQLRICDGPLGEIGENFIALGSVEGVLDQVVNPVNWIHNSFHPNEDGHKAMAGVLASWLDEHPDLAPVPGPDDEPTPFTPASLTDLMGRDVSYCGAPDDGPSFCDRDSTAWAITQVGVSVTKHSPALLALAGGAWLLAMGGLGWWRGRR